MSTNPISSFINSAAQFLSMHIYGSTEQNKKQSKLVENCAQKISEVVENQQNGYMNSHGSYQIYLLEENGKKLTFDVDSSDSILTVKQKYLAVIQRHKTHSWKGIPLADFYLSWGKTRMRLENRTLADLGIEPEFTLRVNLILRLSGGMPEFTFNKLEKAKVVKFDENAPDWRTVWPGLTLKGRCTSQKCPAYNQIIHIRKGMSIPSSKPFNLAAEISDESNKCPACSGNVDEKQITNCGFYCCIYTIEGKMGLPSLKRVTLKNQVAPDDGLLTFEEGTDDLTKWKWLEITTMEKP